MNDLRVSATTINITFRLMYKHPNFSPMNLKTDSHHSLSIFIATFSFSKTSQSSKKEGAAINYTL